ncbi:MAG: TolC family protein [Bacillota bacterium]|nr:TolC family protein [Bacillota bacterium]
MLGKKRRGRFISLILAVFIAAGTLVPAAVAKEPARPQVSLNEAVALALAQSEAVKKAAKEIDRTETLREEAASRLDYTPVGSPGDPRIEIAWSNLLASDLTWRMSKKTLTAQEDAVALDACKKYWDVLKAQEKVEAAEAALKSAERQLQNVQAGYRVGMVTQQALVAAEVQRGGAQASLAGARNELESACVAFNQLIGLWPEDRPVLTDTVEFNPLEIANLDYEVTKALESAPTVWLAQERVTMQKYLEDMMFYTGEYRPYQARKIEVEQAELDAASTKKLFEQVARSLYYSVKGLEEAYAGAQEGVRLAEENLRVAKVKLQAGMATAADVAAAEKALAEARSGAFELACQHAYMKLAFGKPWAYLSGATTGGSTGTASGSAGAS